MGVGVRISVDSASHMQQSVRSKATSARPHWQCYIMSDGV